MLRNADQFLQAGFDDFATKTIAALTTIEVNENFPLLNLESILAPSPNW